MVSMEPALEVIGRALTGDQGACSFLDRTSSIYVLDATDSSKPKTYGCWNFIHQAMNEVERYEAKFALQNHSRHSREGAGLASHVKLLATMAHRVARRGPNVDKSLVSTCIMNASQYKGSQDQSQWLVGLNLELREIVMGRIAATVFDFSFHRQNETHGKSAFADATAMELFCAVLASNAVSSGPQALYHFATEWIIPSAKTLPPFAVSCVVMHLALDALLNSAPAGTKDVFQQLSAPVVSNVIAPILRDAVKESKSTGSDDALYHQRNNQTAAACLIALERWCVATDLSLPQVRHICRKVEINLADVLSDAMYSDSRQVLDGIATLIEAANEPRESTSTVEERMTQVRYLMQVDEASFQSNFTAEQLEAIESKEMESIVEELVSAIGLQRFRFVERQKNADHDVCRTLTRIAASVCEASIRANERNGQTFKTESGLVDLLMKAAAHPSVSISCTALKVMAILVPKQPALAIQLLPFLQRRAITPHRLVSGLPSVAAADICEVDFQEFHSFRETILSDALVACYEQSQNTYMDSCTSAVEEFCSESTTTDVSLHLEAALFCLGAVANEALCSNGVFAHSSQLERCTSALSHKPASMMTNPLTLAEMCRFFGKYTRWYCEGNVQGVLDVAAELALSTFNLSASSFPSNEVAKEMIRETSISPFKEAASTLREVLSHHPENFVSNTAIAALGAGWEASYTACNHNSNFVTIEDREAVCMGICRVLAVLPENQQVRSFHALVLPALDCFDTMAAFANNAVTAKKSKAEVGAILSRVADEIRIIAVMARTFTNACFVKYVSKESGCRTAPVRHPAIPDELIAIVRKVWPSIAHVAKTYTYDQRVSSALSKFIVELLPPECDGNDSLCLLKELCNIASAMIKNDHGNTMAFQPVLDFLVTFVDVHGEAVEKSFIENSKGQTAPDGRLEVVMMLKNIILSTMDQLQVYLGATWKGPKEQGQGQPAFESKSDRAPEGERCRLESVSGIFTLFKMCTERCPVFFLHLPSASGQEGSDDFLFRRGVESAITLLNDADQQASRHAMLFLESMIKLSQSHNENVRKLVSESLDGARRNVVLMLVLGSCGLLSFAVLDEVTRLLCSVVDTYQQEESRIILSSVLRHDHFRLGDSARNAVLEVLLHRGYNGINDSLVKEMLERIWELHRIHDVEMLAASDVVCRFSRHYIRSLQQQRQVQQDQQQAQR